MEELVLYNSLSRQKEPLTPLSNGVRVGLYVCGPTVYGPPHIGHARSAVVFDTLHRYLRFKGYKVLFVRNYTDVGHLEYDADEGEDKIEKQAIHEASSPYEISQKYINIYRRDVELLGCLPPSIEPQATAFIQEQIDITRTLIRKGFAYVVNGSVYFDVGKYNEQYGDYGILSGRKIENLYSYTRELRSQDEKKHSYDFALWKKADDRHIMRWPSPWSDGFPGWHTECIAMSTKFLGREFDIHGGGEDLKFPHHEAEIAQARGVYGNRLARIWMHNNLVNINEQKMSKSLSNYITLNDLFWNKDNMLCANYAPMVLRFLFLQTHYRSPISLSAASLEAARKGLTRIINAFFSLDNLTTTVTTTNNIQLQDKIFDSVKACFKALDDDLNTAQAISHVSDLVNIINDFETNKINISSISADTLNKLKTNFTNIICAILGLQRDIIDDKLKLIVKLYNNARNRQDYSEVDLIRQELQQQHMMMCDFNDHSLLKKK